MHVETRFPCTSIPSSDVYLPIDTERPLTTLKNQLWATGSNAKPQGRKVVDDRRRQRNNLGDPGPRDRCLLGTKDEVGTHLPRDRGRGLEELQTDLDAFLEYHNNERTHQGRWCFGKTPMQTFNDSLPLAKEKLISGALHQSA